jgi:hypothetical protein
MNERSWIVLVLTIISAAGFYFGLGWPAWLAFVVGFVLALLGTVVLVFVLDGDGHPW